MAYCCAYNVFFMDLPVPSFVSHLSSLTVESVNLVVTCDCFLCVTEIVRTFHSGYFDYRGATLITEVLFKQFFIALLYNWVEYS